jgi:hypothetical protein
MPFSALKTLPSGKNAVFSRFYGLGEVLKIRKKSIFFQKISCKGN